MFKEIAELIDAAERRSIEPTISTVVEVKTVDSWLAQLTEESASKLGEELRELCESKSLDPSFVVISTD